MSFDLAIDYNTGDLKISPNNDIEHRVGSDVIGQRIRVRLRIEQGEWPLDPTDGALGSRMSEVFRLPLWRALDEVELVVREALAPMSDIEVVTVTVRQETAKSVTLQIQYRSLLSEDETPLTVSEPIQTVELSVPIGLEA